jgi:hypothetical protein
VNIAALLFACSVHADDAVLLSLAYVHGRGQPYTVVDVSVNGLSQDDSLGIVSSAPSAVAAEAELERIFARGGEPVVGLLPVRPEWAVELGKASEELFEPCTDVAVASAKLSEFDDACKSRGRRRMTERRVCALERYGRSLGLRALGQAVLADLTLPSAFASEEDSVAESWISAPSDSGLFFATGPRALPSLPPLSPPPARVSP